MKKVLSIAMLLLSTGVAKAQLKVSSTGQVGVNSEPFRATALQVGSSYQAIYAETNSCPNFWIPSVEGVAYNGYYTNIGVEGSAGGGSSNADNYNYGVRGFSYGIGNHNYAIFGCLTSGANGAAVYGTTETGENRYGRALTTRYAGYFAGEVLVNGVFNYTGTLLASSAPTASLESSASLASQVQSSKQAYTSLLGQLTPTTYYKEAEPVEESNPLLQSRDADALQNKISTDAVTETPLSLHERQLYSKQHYGLNADELEEVFPDLVYDNEDGTKSINYVEMVPILIQAINELSSEVNALKGSNGTVKKAPQQAAGIDGEDVLTLSLGQNKPNPFGTSTSIAVTVPETVQAAFLYVYDLQGKKVQQVDITARGAQSVQLSAADLADGMYLYSLVADGKVVETKRMIVEK